MLLKYFINKIAQDNVPEIEKKSCLHYRNVKKECNICVETCPTSAITKKGIVISIEDELCTSCGICKVNCPSQAITMKYFGENKIPKAVEENQMVMFGCQQESSAGNVILPCLNGLHPELLTALFLQYRGKKFLFNLSQCDTCSIGVTVFETSLKKALQFLEDTGVEGQYEIIKNSDDIPELTPKEISRRELFNIFKEGSVNHATEMVNSAWGKRIDYTLNQRSLLLDEINALTREKSFEIIREKTLFSNYQVSSKCDGCNYCKAICSYQAWRVEEAENTYILSHNVGKCRGCNHCLETCPQGAIEKTTLTSSAFEGFKVKVKREIGKCKKCNRTYVQKENGNDLCTACSKREELRKSLFKQG